MFLLWLIVLLLFVLLWLFAFCFVFCLVWHLVGTFVFCGGLVLCLFEWSLIGFVGLLLGILMLGCGCLVCMLVWCEFWVADCVFVVFCYFLL